MEKKNLINGWCFLEETPNALERSKRKYVIAGRDNFAFCHGSRQGISVSISIAAEMVYYKFV